MNGYESEDYAAVKDGDSESAIAEMISDVIERQARRGENDFFKE